MFCILVLLKETTNYNENENENENENGIKFYLLGLIAAAERRINF